MRKEDYVRNLKWWAVEKRDFYKAVASIHDMMKRLETTFVEQFEKDFPDEAEEVLESLDEASAKLDGEDKQARDVVASFLGQPVKEKTNVTE